MNITSFIILGFITWRCAHLVADEHGPFWMFAHLRRRVREACRRGSSCHQNCSLFDRFAHRLHMHEMLTCEWCNSIWIGMIVTALYVWLGQVVIYFGLFLALSTFTIFMKTTQEALVDLAKVFLKLSIRIQKTN